MNRAIILNTWREMLSSVNRLVLVGLLSVLPLLSAIGGSGRPGAPTMGLIFVWVLGAGIIGSALASGSLQIVFVRPVTRASYVLSKWLALCGAAFAAYLAQALLALIATVALGNRPEWDIFASSAAQSVVVVAGAASVMVLFSSLFSGLGDLRTVFLVWLGAQILKGVGGVLSSLPRLENGELYSRVTLSIAARIDELMSPTIDLALAYGQGWPLALVQVVPFLSTVTLSLALAIMVMNRKELTYATD